MLLCLGDALTNVLFLFQQNAWPAATPSTVTAPSPTNACEYPLHTFVLND